MSDSPESDSPESAPFTDADVQALIEMMRVYRFAGVFLLALYDDTRVNLNALGEFTVTSAEYKELVLEQVREHKAAWQDDIGDGFFQWRLTPLGTAAIEKRLAEDQIFALAGI